MYFPKSYDDAITRIRSAVLPLKAQAGRWGVGPGLDIDHFYWPASGSPETLFFLMSGVHGPETYAGHAIQMMFLNEIFPKLKGNCGVFMVHSLNPFGFKHHVRATAGHVNLNRNCSIDPSLFEIKNQASLDVERRFVPREPLNSTECLLLRSMRRDGDVVRFGSLSMDDFIRAVAMGQYSDPMGLEFGGFRLEPQVEALAARLREVLPAYRDLVFFDLHTGLGHRGRLHLLTGEKSKGLHPELLKKILDSACDQDIYEYTPNDHPGFYATYGSTNDLLAELTGADQRTCALTMEFGTLGHDLDAQIEGLNIWMCEHQGARYGYSDPGLEREVKHRHFERFYPSAPDWSESVIRASRTLFQRVLTRLGHLSSVS